MGPDCLSRLAPHHFRASVALSAVCQRRGPKPGQAASASPCLRLMVWIIASISRPALHRIPCSKTKPWDLHGVPVPDCDHGATAQPAVPGVANTAIDTAGAYFLRGVAQQLG